MHFWKYQGIVWGYAIRETIQNQFDRKNWFWNALAAGVALAFYLIFNDLRATMDYLFSLGAILAGVSAVTLGSVAYHRVIASAVFYRRLQRSQYKLTWQDVEITPYRFPKTSGYGLGLRVICHKDNNVTIYHPVVNAIKVNQGIKKYDDTISMSVLSGVPPVFPPTGSITNRENYGQRSKIIDVIPISNWSEDKKAFLEFGNKTLPLDLNKTLRIDLEISCESLNVNLIPVKLEKLTLVCDIIYHNIIGIRWASLKIVERTPKYEF